VLYGGDVPHIPPIDLSSWVDVVRLMDLKIWASERKGGFQCVLKAWLPGIVINPLWCIEESCSQVQITQPLQPRTFRMGFGWVD